MQPSPTHLGPELGSLRLRLHAVLKPLAVKAAKSRQTPLGLAKWLNRRESHAEARRLEQRPLHGHAWQKNDPFQRLAGCSRATSGRVQGRQRLVVQNLTRCTVAKRQLDADTTAAR